MGKKMTEKPKVFLYESMHQQGIDYLQTHAEVLWASSVDEEDVICREVSDASGIIVRALGKVSARVMDSAPKLKVVGRHGAGVDNIDIEAATERGIQVVNTPDAPTEAVAEHVIATMIVLARRILEADKAIREGRWDFRYSTPGQELTGKILGVVGMGRIGYRLSEIAALGLGMKILYCDIVANKNAEEKLGAKKMDLNELLVSSDVVTLHVPATPTTKHLINASKLKLMKPSSFLINAARGSIVDIEALYDALKDGKLLGAGIDVFEEEPPPVDMPILKLPNVVITPHTAGQTEQAVTAMSMVAEDIIRVINGQKPRYSVN